MPDYPGIKGIPLFILDNKFFIFFFNFVKFELALFIGEVENAAAFIFGDKRIGGGSKAISDIF